MAVQESNTLREYQENNLNTSINETLNSTPINYGKRLNSGERGG